MYRLLSVAVLALGMVVMTASAKEYKNVTILKMDDDSITVKFEGSDKEVKVKISDKTAYARPAFAKGKGKNKDGGTGEETEAKKEAITKGLEKAGDKGVKATLTTEGDDKEDPAKDTLAAKKILIQFGGMGKGKGNKDTGAKKDL